jgi:hypothetical protein
MKPVECNKCYFVMLAEILQLMHYSVNCNERFHGLDVNGAYRLIIYITLYL